MRESPLPPSEIQRFLQDRLDEISPWEGAGSTRCTYPVTSPTLPAVETITAFWERNSNNIGAHLESADSLRGTRRLEREVVRDIATLLHAPDADGWLTSGGTEGNITGLWLGRERLAEAGETSPPVFTTCLAHDSVRKACRVLGLKTLVELPLRGGAVLDPKALQEAIEEYRRMGIHGAIVVATVGATLTGTCDPVDEIAAALPKDMKIHLHVDAAFAGLVLPFTDPRREFDFRVDRVNSLVVDLHKMARIPLGVGVFLAGNGETEVLTTTSTCAHCNDRTLIGSRPGALAAVAWAGLNSMGRSGFRAALAHCLSLKARFLERLKSCPNLRVIHDEAVNAVGIVPTDPVSAKVPRERVYFMPHLSVQDIEQIAREIIQRL